MKTLNGNQTQSSLAGKNLQVAGNGSGKKHLIKPPKSYSREELPVNEQEVATTETIAKWQNLQSISKTVCQENNVNVGVLIGANSQKQ